MAYQLNKLFEKTRPPAAWSATLLEEQIERLLSADGPRYRRLWAYYRNPMQTSAVGPDERGSERPYRHAQEWGLPSRVTGIRSGVEIFAGTPVEGVARKEVVVENDIGWRIDTIVEYLFGKPIIINSAASDPDRRAVIDALLREIIAHNGGIVFLQQLALLGAVYGFIDVLVKLDTSSIDDDRSTLETDPARSSILESSSSTFVTSRGTAELGQPPVTHDELTMDGDAPSTTERRDDAPAPQVSEAGPFAAPDPAAAPGASNSSREAIERLARRVRLEIVEPARALPLLDPEDYRCVSGYAQVYQIEKPKDAVAQATTRARKTSLIERLRTRFGSGSIFGAAKPNKTLVVEIITAEKWQRYEDEILVAEGTNSLGVLPLVHVQNTSVPFEYPGASEVESLIPIQDEINARLSDRAYRIAMQSFKMYLGVGIENFMQASVSPGQMWVTDNENAKVIEFGGDGKTFSEDNHMAEMREAMDKISGVTPIAAGALKGRIGRLTSAAALRVTMLALLAKTERKRTAYGPAIERMCELALQWLDAAGLFHTTPQERRVEIHWPSPIPVNELERLEEADAKLKLGVPREIVLRELGY